jgi:hypothetical protein
MDANVLIQNYPTLYHMAEDGSWPSIKKYGLLSTSALLDMLGIEGQQRYTIENCQRKESIVIKNNNSGSVVIRDQKPLHEGALQKLIDGMPTKEFYKLLNGKTFFWVRRARLESLLKARAYRSRPHCVLTVDSKTLINKYSDSIWLSHINSGAIFGSGRRGVGTFKRITEYPFDEMKRKKKDDAVVELAVDYGVKDISDFVIRVETWIEGKPCKTIWTKAL